jgi:hypothetical protein
MSSPQVVNPALAAADVVKLNVSPWEVPSPFVANAEK